MKFLVAILLTALLIFAFGLYMPWWSMVIAAFVVAFFIPQKPGWAFLSGFLAGALLWGVMAAVISGNNDGILASKMSALILKKNAPGTLMVLTAMLAALPSGAAALSASLLKGIIARRSANA